MVEDKLDRNERRRLESLAQAVAYIGYKHDTTADDVVAAAKRFEQYVGEDS